MADWGLKFCPWFSSFCYVLAFFSATEWRERNMGFSLYLSWVFDLRQIDLKENTHTEKRGWMIYPIYIIYTVRFETYGDLSMILFFIIRLKHWDLIFILLFFIISIAKYIPSYTLYIFILLETIYSGLEHCSCFWKGWGNSTKCLPFMIVDIASLVHCV